MLAKTESEFRIGCENHHKQNFVTSRIQPSRTDYSNIPQIDWACPPRFMMNPNWKIEAGSESKETHIQLQRESTTPEAIYYRVSKIPPNPYVASNAHDFNDGIEIPVIPLDVISDDTSPVDPLISLGPVEVGEKVDKTTQPVLQREEVIGAAVALVALIKSRELGSQIDLELLTELLCNPGLRDQLMKEHGLLDNQSSVVTSACPDERSSVRSPVSAPTGGSYSSWSPSTPFIHSTCQGVKDTIQQVYSRSESQNPSSNKEVDSGKLRTVVAGPNVVKDVDYYKRLIEPVKPGLAVVKYADYYKRLIDPVKPEHDVVKDADYYKRLIDPVKPDHDVLKDADYYRRVVKPVKPGPDVVKDVDYYRRLIDPVKPDHDVVKNADYYRRVVKPVKPGPDVVKDVDYYRRLMEPDKPGLAVVKDVNYYNGLIGPVKPGPSVVNGADHRRRLIEPVKPGPAAVKDVDYYRRLIEPVKPGPGMVEYEDYYRRLTEPVKPGPVVVKDEDYYRRLIEPVKPGPAMVEDGDYYRRLTEPVKPGPAVVKNTDYYRRLVSLHGMTQEDRKPQGSVNPIGSRERRPCLYFNSPKGCRDGPSCRFKHVKEGSGEGSRAGNWAVGEHQGAKRMKLFGGNFARHT